MMIIPNKLKKGDEVRVIAPCRSASILSEDGIVQAIKTLEDLGFVVTFGKHIYECDLQGSSSIESRVSDLHEAFKDSNVKAILTVIGGYNSNEILPYIDYELLRQNPKILCGYSDVTALTTAIMTKCDFITYSGPHFSSFQMIQAQTYQSEFFVKCFMQNEPYIIKPSAVWSDDAWYSDQENRYFERTEWKVYSQGKAEGTLYGGNLCTLNLLQGTSYLSPLKDSILFVEDDYLVSPEIFARDLASLLQYCGQIRGLVIGRFQRDSKMTEQQLHFILDKHPLLKRIPVMYDVDFGHTQPIFTFPLGGEVKIDTDQLEIELLKF